MVYLITGKAGAGKTHYSQALAKEFTDEGIPVATLDGDAIRNNTGNHDFTDKGRINNLTFAAKLAQIHEDKGEVVILSFIAPKKKWRDMMRTYWEKSRVIYIPGGTLWKDTTYEKPTEDELNLTHKINI